MLAISTEMIANLPKCQILTEIFEVFDRNVRDFESKIVEITTEFFEIYTKIFEISPKIFDMSTKILDNSYGKLEISTAPLAQIPWSVAHISPADYLDRVSYDF